MSPNNADGMANSVDPDQSSLIWVCTICSGLSVQKLRIITVGYFCHLKNKHISDAQDDQTFEHRENMTVDIFMVVLLLDS